MKTTWSFDVHAGDKKDDDAANPEAQESTAEFTPVVQLDEVEVKTHEEDEDVDFKIRAKLFRFSETLLNKGSGKKEWIERGVGEVKLLKHRENSMVRVLMRQEKTMKIICMISASRGAAAPPRHRRASSPGEEVVGGLFFDFEAVRTA
jgi:hypothetical protein